MCSRLVRIPSLSVGRSPFGPSITRCMLLCVRRGQNSSPCSSSCSPRTSMHLPTKEPIFEQGSRQAAGSDPLLGFCDVWPPALLRMTLLQASTHLVRARARVKVKAREGCVSGIHTPTAAPRSLFGHRTDAVHAVGRTLQGCALLPLPKAGHASARGLID